MKFPKTRFKPDFIHEGLDHSEHRRHSISAGMAIMAFCLLGFMLVIFLQVGISLGRQYAAQEKAQWEICIP